MTSAVQDGHGAPPQGVVLTPDRAAQLGNLYAQIVQSVQSVLYADDDTVQLAVGCLLAQGHLLVEDLPGLGKTTLAKGIAEGFGAAEADDVTSPTFTLIHEYHGPDKDVYHIDLYRLEKPGELDSLGLDDLMTEERNVLLIEWGEKFPRILQQKDAEIVIRRVGHDERKLRLTTGLES